MRRAGTRALALAASLSCALAARAQTVVELRGGRAALSVEVATVSAAGVELRGGDLARASADGTAFGATVPLDLVAGLQGRDRGAFGAEFARIAEDLWRARIRLERGDEVLAEPLVDRHWDRYRDADGPTAALVAESRLRCALARGDIAGSVEPWLACLRHRESGVATRFPGLAPVIDAETGLLPELSPFAPAAQRAVVVAACEAAGKSAATAEVAALLVKLARGEAAAAAAGRTVAEARAEARKGVPAVRALELLVQIAGAGEAAALERAVGAFDGAFGGPANGSPKDPPGPLAAWRLAAIGTAKARIARAATVPERRNAELSRAALDLLAVPASGLDRTGLVDAYAFEMAAQLMKESGEPTGAARLEELARSAAGSRGATGVQRGETP